MLPIDKKSKREMVSGRQTFSSWIQRFPGLSSTHPPLDSSALWLRPALPQQSASSTVATTRSPSQGNNAGGSAGAGAGRDAKEVQTDESDLLLASGLRGDQDGSLMLASSSSLHHLYSPIQLGNASASSFRVGGGSPYASIRQGFVPSSSGARRQPLRVLELSFVDEEEEEGTYGLCDDAMEPDPVRPVTDLDRLLNVPADPVWVAGGLHASAARPHDCQIANGWAIDEAEAASFGVVAVTDGRDTLSL
jgi:hypothetical protein